MTDRGRVYIILGEPLDKETYEGSADIAPTEIWFYKGDVSKGLPAFFYVVFFRKEGTGEYILYSPLKDGPESLVIDSKMRMWDRTRVLEHLREMGGQLADVSLSLIPGESVSRDGSSLPLSSDLLLGKINDYQRKRINDEYAEKTLKFKEIVEVDYSVNYIESFAELFPIKDRKGNYFLHYQIEPKRLSLDLYQSKYFTSLKIYGKIQDLSGRNIFQFEKSIPLELKEEEFNTIKNKPFSITDSFPVIPGNYNLSILVKNTASKEFFSFERQISIPSASEIPYLSPILLFYERNPTSSSLVRSFNIEGFSYLLAMKGVYAPSDKMGVLCKACNLPKSSMINIEWKIRVVNEEKEFLSKTYSSLQFQEIPSHKRDRVDQVFVWEIPLSDFKPGNYELILSILENGKELVSEKRDFSISPIPRVPRAWIVSKPTFKNDDPFIDFTLGIQYLNTGKIEEAISVLESAKNKKPDSMEFSLALSRAFLLKNSWSKVIEIMTPFLSSETKSYEPFYFVAKAHHNFGEYARAIDHYKKALSLKGLDTEILNSIGYCYLKMENREEARKAFEKSIEINPAQKNISELLKNLKERKKGGEFYSYF